MKSNLHSLALGFIMSLTCLSASAEEHGGNMGYYRDTFISDSIWHVEIKKYDDGAYTVYNPYDFASSMDFSLFYSPLEDWARLPISKKDNIRAYFHPISYYDKQIMHIYDFESTTDLYEFYRSDIEEQHLEDIYQGVTKYKANGEPGIIQMVSMSDRSYQILGGDGRYNGIITVYMPGQVAVYETEDEHDANNKAYIHSCLSGDVDHASLYVTKNDDNADAYLSDPKNAINIDKSMTTTYECATGGRYLMKLVGYDKAGQEVSSVVDTFYHAGTVNVNDTWVTRYIGKLYPLDNDNMNKQYPIEAKDNLILYQSVENPSDFKIGEAFGDYDFYFSMTESESLDKSSEIKWEDQKSDLTYGGHSFIFCSIQGHMIGNGMPTITFEKMTKYDSASKTFCFPLFNGISKSTYVDFYNVVYFKLQEVLDDTSVGKVTASESTKAARYYNVNGQQTDALRHGLNIVRFSDGTNKVVMKR